MNSPWYELWTMQWTDICYHRMPLHPLFKLRMVMVCFN